MSSLTPIETIENKAKELSQATPITHLQNEANIVKSEQNAPGTAQKVGTLMTKEAPTSTQQNLM